MLEPLSTLEVLSALNRAHRDTQADHRAALAAADQNRDLDTAARDLRVTGDDAAHQPIDVQVAFR